MLSSTTRIVRVSGVVFSALVALLLLRALFRGPAPGHHPSRLRVEEPVVVILVHPSPSLNKATNFELKRAIARTWAKDVEDFGASVFFVGEHDSETVMRRPSEFQGRAQSLSSRFGPGSLLAKAGTAAGAGPGSDSTGYSKEEPMRKMLIPSVLENGQADDPSGLLKAYHFLYNNTNWYAGPIFQTYPFILTTDTTHYIHVENLVSTLLSSRPRRLLTMKDDLAFSGSVSEASACSAEDVGDKSPLQTGDVNSDLGSNSLGQGHWTLSRTHLVSKQLVAMVGPHLRQCIKAAASSLMDSGEAFKDCIKDWASNPLFWKDGYCGRLAALRYQAPAPGSTLSSWGSSSASSHVTRKERRGSPPSPEEFQEFYRMKQQERAMELKRQKDKGDGYDGRRTEEEAADDPLFQSRENDLQAEDPRQQLQKLTSSSSDSSARWIVASGLTQPEDFTLVHQSLVDREEDGGEEYSGELDY